jgi:ABC-type multidrug transport system ATPase subunit
MSHLTLAAEGLVVGYDRGAPVLDGATLAVPAGRRLAVLGANGSGKTTLLRCAATLLRPSEGTLAVAGVDPAQDGSAARALLGYAGEGARLYGELTVEENLRFAARFYPGGPARVAGLLDAVGLAARASQPAVALSRGLAQRACLARALVGAPRLLLLDEAFAGLDADGLARAHALIAQAARDGAGVLAAAPGLEHAPPATGRVLALRDGALSLDARGTLPELRARLADAKGGA